MKQVIITGTSSGIGFELVKIFAKKNYKILAISRNTKPLEIFKNNKNVRVASLDLTIPKHIEKLSEIFKKEYNEMDILINNAGFLKNIPFEKTTFHDFLEVYKVNVFAVAQIIQKALPYLKKQSHVVNISSMGGVQGSLKFAGLSAYSSSKGALITLTELLAEEYKKQEIKFNVLALGAVQTKMLSEAFPEYKAPLKASEMADYIFDFATKGHLFYNGKILPVSSTHP